MIVDYFLGKGMDDDGRTVNDYLSLDDYNLESERGFVPWVFPSTEKSNSFPNAPIMDQDIVNKFREDTILREMTKQVVNRYLKFLNNTSAWRNTADAGHLRITRMIRFLATIRMSEEATKVAKWCTDKSGASKKIKASWEEATNFKPEWERERKQDAENTPKEL
jgi:hypothetical protein